MSQESELLIRSAVLSLPGGVSGLSQVTSMPTLSNIVYEYIKTRNGQATSRELVTMFGQDSSIRKVIRALKEDNRIMRSRTFAPDGSILQSYRVSKKSERQFAGNDISCPN